MTQKDLAGVVTELRVAFGGRVVLGGVSLDIAAGAVTAVLGRSGSGKTTLLRALNRLNALFPGCRTEGRARLRLGGDWRELYGPGAMDGDALRARVGMVFQAPNVLPGSIRRNMTLALRLVVGLSREKARERMERALAEAQLWDEVRDRLDENALRLSGGQQQRLCLARALALEPEILLLDEPTASLDYVAAGRVEALLAALAPRRTLVLVSHSLAQARRLADRAVVLREGRIVRELAREELTQRRTLETCIEDAP
ncbi:MAG: ATP-binding cassette domain-containing protein [Solidesulfovibrio sp.]|uniref:phosphate ABC transporter ATP-binding protein n=1 Tax=Solidesulfovibrio sp. TaxID=2910990 RepID=UPI002B1EB81E|nr:ATP-binding cassette domain-containing protein [Solidesulfovibrio sp.]MEA4855412.1 ATP-binding cassette domain-containing protein [Solidesulfovibrio sp.]